ncbi:Fun14p Ecym_2620 [Eremothecium cymbalariae DBVPG|uniref:Protein FUN14 n=1 Tax=Eremothecium cymbalariae (strain CBS 270.75 / DBVPG 7215 / KCTC 17166 / NRRL Y-17582) TaxID=931890 RepID=G8JQK0_ERECY|nr:Hypothetical protein Ecym_2620 [Eremothecium cymbalariae DBVPG\
MNFFKRPLDKARLVNWDLLRFGVFSYKNISQNTIRTTAVTFPRNLNKMTPRLMMYTGVIGSALSLQELKSPVIRNDFILSAQDFGLARKDASQTSAKHATATRARFNGKLNYRQLCVGSISGLTLGVIIGKVSNVLAFITVFSLLTLQWLQNRGLLDKGATKGLSQYIVNTGRERVDLNTLVWEKPSFKVSFLLTFFLAAINV